MVLTEHAMNRMRQRGITDSLLHLVYMEADRLAPCGGGCTAVQISRKKANRLRILIGSDAERARNVVLVVSGDGVVVTALRRGRRSYGRCHSRGRREA